MTTTERTTRRLRKRRIVAASVIAPTLAACGSPVSPAAPLAPAVLPASPHPPTGEGRRGVKPKPLVSVKPHPRATPKPRVVVTPRVTTLPGRRLRITMYCYTGSRTASGTWPKTGDVATLDRSIPFGTRLRVVGLGTFTVTDRIGHGSDVDIYSGDRPDCEHRASVFGIQHRIVEREAA